MLRGLLPLILLGACAPVVAQSGSPNQDAAPARKPLSAATLAHIAESKRLVADGKVPFSYLSSLYNTVRGTDLIEQELLPKANESYGPGKVRPTLEPTRIFDQVYYFGNDNVGALVLVTPQGIIQWDAMNTDEDARDIILAGYRKFGLDPSQIKYLIITHGHGDHYGGVNYLKTFSPDMQVLAGAADWDLMARVQPRTDRPFSPPPARGGNVTDGQRLTLGGTTVTLYVTPGHTPGTVSAIIPVTQNGKRHLVGLFGGLGNPLHLGPRPESSGLDEYIRQWKRFGSIARAAGVEGALATHAGHDGTVEYIPKLAKYPKGYSPWLLGRQTYARYLKVNEEVSQAIRGAIFERGERTR